MTESAEMVASNIPQQRCPQEDLRIEKYRQNMQRRVYEDNEEDPRYLNEECCVCYEEYTPEEVIHIKDPINGETRVVCLSCHKTPRQCGECIRKIELSWYERTSLPMDRCKNHQKIFCEACQDYFTPNSAGGSYVD